MDEVPGTQPPPLPFDQQEALTGEDEGESLLSLLAVIEGIGLARAENPQPEAELGEPSLSALERRVEASELASVETTARRAR